MNGGGPSTAASCGWVSSRSLRGAHAHVTDYFSGDDKRGACHRLRPGDVKGVCPELEGDDIRCSHHSWRRARSFSSSSEKYARSVSDSGIHMAHSETVRGQSQQPVSVGGGWPRGGWGGAPGSP